MKHKAQLRYEGGGTATGYYCQIGEKHYLILDDAEMVWGDDLGENSIIGFFEIDPDTLQPMRTFGSTIAVRRKHLGFSQEKLARMAGVSRNYVSQIEGGKGQNLSAKVLFALGDALGIECEELIKMWRVDANA